MALGIAVRDAQSGGPITTQRAGVRMVILYPWLVLIWIPFVGPLLGLIADVWSLVCGLSPLWNDRRQGYHDVSQKHAGGQGPLVRGPTAGAPAPIPRGRRARRLPVPSRRVTPPD